MSNTQNVAIIIPALNEAHTIGPVVTEIRALGFDVYVVDDCSNDGTDHVALAAGAIVLRMPFATGAWGAIQAGMLYALKSHAYECFITMDADGQHRPEFIPILLDKLETSPADVLIGSFPQRGSAARKLAWKFFSCVTGLRVQDLTSGFRVYGRNAAEVLMCREAVLFDYQDLGVLLLLRRMKIDFQEVPVAMCAREDGCSRIFNSWFSVFSYMLKTCLWIMTDYVSGSKKTTRDWTEYDGI
ncbi:glycosyltransferase [Pseudodesulfovibrio sp. JC047]|uniref:glycosyltransferase family 2 protein n=1 Tax=Pseudodesulfovibrio sp. JC047 TaxID=2683199 RepID=UPI0013D6215A|nr:glycosyltransferase family 2 protein [Pseudodesulfovibrio sp. JC047]NDV20291.1 glycosyltransferase [Pseudodesulfovibrio sp. JC047]